MRRAGRVDVVQPELVQALEAAHFSVRSLASLGDGCPDLLAGGNVPCIHCRRPNKANLLIEAKAADGKLTPDQLAFHLEWRGQLAIARTVEEALRIAGIQR